MDDVGRGLRQPDLPSRWDLARLSSEGAGIRIICWPIFSSEQLQGLSILEELKAFLRRAVRQCYDSRKSQVDQSRPNLMREAERFLYPPGRSDNPLGREHLQAMDRPAVESVGLRGYGQKDPLIEYKKRGLRHVPRT